VSPASTSLPAYLRIGAKLMEEKLPDRRSRCGTGRSANCKYEELRTFAGEADRGIGLAVPLAPMNRRGFAYEIGDARSSSLSRVGKDLRGSSGIFRVGVRERDGSDDTE
jgi:hypothetical protein